MRGVYVDTGLMREGETDFVRRLPGLEVEHAEAEFLSPRRRHRSRAEAPHHRRGIRAVQERVIERAALLDDQWILGQGTIYPDTIESGGTAKAALIKTHHNRVAGIQN